MVRVIVMFFYQYTKTQIEKELDTSMARLIAKVKRSRLLKYGENTLPETKPEIWFYMFLGSLKTR